MKIAYIIHAYKLPEQLARMLTLLSNDNSYFFIHIDKKVDIDTFKKEIEKKNIKNIIWVEREFSNWGTINCVKSVLNGLFTALQHVEVFQYFYCLSGQDYPIKPIKYIEDFFSKNKEITFIKYFELPHKGWKGGGVHRYNRYHFIISKNRYVRRIVNVMNFFLPRRQIPYDLKPFGGEFYLGLSRESAVYLKEFITEKPKYLEFFKYTYIPEEIFFQTILLNAPNKIKFGIVNKTLTYVDWNNPKNGKPAVLRKADLNTIKKVDHLFARKLDVSIDREILDLIDTQYF